MEELDKALFAKEHSSQMSEKEKASLQGRELQKRFEIASIEAEIYHLTELLSVGFLD